MKKAVITKFGDSSVISVIEADIPKLANEEVLVKVKAAALNPKDILIRKGKFKKFSGKKFPQGIGFDFSGIIEETNNTSFQKGDAVFGMINGWHGRCCAEYVNVKATELSQKPDNISFPEAAGIPLAAQTALQALRNSGKLKSGQKVLINGASGGVGTLAIQIARELGAEVTTVSSSKNLDFCESLGSNETLSYEKIDIRKIDRQFNLFFDVFGNYDFSKVNHLLSEKGRYVTTVPKPSIIKEQLKNPFRSKKAKLVVVKSKSSDLEWLAGKLTSDKLKSVIDKVLPLDQIKEAQEYIETKRARGKVVIDLEM